MTLAMFVLRQLRTIRRSVSRSVLQSLVSSLVLSRLDYGNATLVGISSHLFSRLQSVMNTAARLIFSSSKFQHITPLLRPLHWLKAPDSGEECIQIFSPCVQVSSRVRTCIPYRRALSDMDRGWSPTSFQFIFVTDCQPHPTVYSRWPSFSGRRCSRLEHWDSLPDLVTSAPSVAVFRSRLKTPPV